MVTGDALQALLEGRDPASGTPLGTALVDRHRADGRKIEAVAGFDATFSSPKSLSILWALTSDERVLAIHDQAVAVALAHLERFGATTRVRVNGARQHPDTNGLTMAVFRQSTSRADDPQLHTHVVISTKVQTADGRWWALDGRYLKGHQRMLGGLYQTAVRAGMRHQFGVAWERVVNGQAEMSFELSAEAQQQLALRYHLAAEAAKSYYRAGFTVVYQDIITHLTQHDATRSGTLSA